MSSKTWAELARGKMETSDMCIVVETSDLESDSDEESVGMVCGENGHLELSRKGFNNDLLALFQKLVRGMEEREIHDYVRDICEEAAANMDANLIKNLFLLAFNTRNCRGGKGEKKIFYFMLKALYAYQPLVVLGVLDMIPKYGYWKDLFLLLVELEPLKGTEGYDRIRSRIFDICAEQHRADLNVLNDINIEKKELSLYAKFVPSEKSSLDKSLQAVKEIAKRVYGDVIEKKMMFRTDIGAMRKNLRVTETFMCSQEFSKINFASVPSVCLARNTLAFLNDRKGADMTETGTRYPDDMDRVTGRKHLIACILKNKVKGKQVYPHSLVETVMNRTSSVTGLLVVNAQWQKMREGVLQQVEERKERLQQLTSQGLASVGVDLGNCVCMSDVSGSMIGTPMMVSIAMGILLSEISHPAFRDVVMTFSSDPMFHNLSKCNSLVEKVESLSRAHWHCSTDFYKALRLIGQVARCNKLEQEELPNLLVVSDMQFNQASESRSWNTAFTNIKSYFQSIGYAEPPTIIFWNVRAGSTGFPCRSNQEGVVLMSGFSPALMKFILSGDLETEEVQVDEETGVVTKVRRKVTPEEMLQKVLEDDTLEDIRSRLDQLSEVIEFS